MMVWLCDSEVISVTSLLYFNCQAVSFVYSRQERKTGFMESDSEHLITSSINNAIITGCVDFESRRGVVRIETMLLAGRSRVREPVWKRISPKNFSPALEPTQPPIQWVPGFFPRVKADGV
jgi:hypothetical protein